MKLTTHLCSLFFILFGFASNLDAQQTKPDTTRQQAAPTAVNSDLAGKFSTLEATIKALEAKLSSMESTQGNHPDALKLEVENRIKKATLFADFLQSANTSVNAMLLSSNLSAYLNDVSALNNPTNQDLGFSLAEQVEKVMEKNVFKGRAKIAGQEKGRFMGFVKNILNSPITTAIAGIFPVVSSITSVTNMVAGAALGDKDISVQDVAGFNTDLKVFVAHYEGLAAASYQFNVANITIKAKLDQLQNLLRNIAHDRIDGLYEAGKVDQASLQAAKLSDILDQHYNATKVEVQMQAVLNSFKEGDKINYASALNDKRFLFPDYEIGRASSVSDLLDAHASEILVALGNYQHNLEAVLTKSKEAGIGDGAKIDARILQMRKSLEEVVKSFENAVHTKDVHNKFQRLVNRV
jgi:hypothetical protein